MRNRIGRGGGSRLTLPFSLVVVVALSCSALVGCTQYTMVARASFSSGRHADAIQNHALAVGARETSWAQGQRELDAIQASIGNLPFCTALGDATDGVFFTGMATSRSRRMYIRAHDFLRDAGPRRCPEMWRGPRR